MKIIKFDMVILDAPCSSFRSQLENILKYFSNQKNQILQVKSINQKTCYKNDLN